MARPSPWLRLPWPRSLATVGREYLAHPTILSQPLRVRKSPHSVPSTVLATRLDSLAPSKHPELGAESRWAPTAAGQTVASVARDAKEADVFEDFDVLDAGLEPLLDELAIGLLAQRR